MTASPLGLARAALLVGLLLAPPAAADPVPLHDDFLHDDYLRADQLPAPPPAYGDAPWNVVDLDDLVVVRVPDHALASGFDHSAFTRAIQVATANRDVAYDIAAMVHSDDLPTQFTGAAAFHLAYNNADVWGSGRDPVQTPAVPVRSGLWLNAIAYWDRWPEGSPDWVFCHEVGHQWLAFPEVPDPDGGDAQALLGRQRAHWSYWVSTDNSPMEGNAWVDNGDSTWTTDPATGGVFTPLDLYLLGLLPADEVPPVTVLEPLSAEPRSRESAPEWLWYDAPYTVAAAASSWTIDDLVAANGLWESTIGHTAADLELLFLVVVGPEEPVTDALLAGARARRDAWKEAWSTCTGGRSDLRMGVVDEGRALPSPAAAPALTPLGAW